MTVDPALTRTLNELGETMGLGSLTLDDDGSVALQFDDLPAVNLQYRQGEDLFWLYADLGVPAAGAAAYEDLLRGNLFWRATLGATFALSGGDPPSVVLSQPLPWRGATVASLANVLATFANTIEDWAQVLKAATTDTDAAADPASRDVEDFNSFIRV